MTEPALPIAYSEDKVKTRGYREFLRAPAADLCAQLSQKYKDTEFILVRGFLTDALDRLGFMMVDQMRAVQNFGCSVRKPGAAFDSENPPDVNAIEIARLVESANSRVVLITHSKGSVDTLAALLNYSNIHTRIAGWVSVQGAIQGSAVADFLAGPPGASVEVVDAAKRAAMRAALTTVFTTILKGSTKSLESLRTKDRVDYLSRNETKIRAIVGQFPTIAFGSSAPKSRSGLRSTTDVFFKEEPHNDGLMAVGRTVIPGAGIVHDLDGPDHFEAVTDVPGQRCDRIAMTYALLSVLT